MGFDRRAPGSRAIDPIERAAAETVANFVFDSLELRQMMAAHIVGSTVSYATIQSAVDAAQSGATITVDAGNYAEMVTISKPLTLLGARAGVDARTRTGSESVLTGSTGASGVSTIFYVTANDVTLDGFTIQGNTSATNMGAGIVMAPNIHGTHVVNNIIQNNFSGLFLSNNSNTDACVIQGNKFNNNAGGGSYDGVGNKEIYSDGSYAGPVLTNVFIDNNSFYAPNDQLQGAIDLHSASSTPQSNITISNNTFDHTGKLLLINCNNVTLLHNTITNQTDTGSAAVRFEGHNNVIDAQYNSIYSNGGVAMAVDDKGYEGPNSGLTLTNNNIYQDGAGLYIDGDNYVGTANVTNNWWGNASGPSHDGSGTGLAVGNAAFNQNPSIWTWQWKTGAGPEVFSPWATSLLNLTNVPAPASPSSFVATALSSRSIQLSWSAPSSTATSQLLQRSTDGVNFTTVATLPPLLNSFVDTSVTSGMAYTYRVIASNATGNSAASNTAAATPPAYQPPVAPPALNVSGTTSTTATLAWTAPSYAVGLAGYVVYRNGTAVGTVAAGTTTFTDTGLAASTGYAYTVATLDNTGATSAPTAAVTARTAALPQIVFNDGSFETTRTSTYVYRPSTPNWTFTGNSGLQANGSAWNAVNAPDGTQTAFLQGNGSTATVTQTFAVNKAGTFAFIFSLARRNGNAAQPILVTIDGNSAGTYTPSSSAFQSFTTGNVLLGVGNHTISFSTTASSGDNTSFLDAVGVKTIVTAPPAVPTGLAAPVVGKTQINLSWDLATDSPANIILQRSTDGTTFTTVVTLTGTATSYADTGLTAGTKYFYRLLASNTVGSSAASSAVSTTTMPAATRSVVLSSLAWKSATTGWGTVKTDTSVTGKTITIRGQSFTNGIGVNADSTIVYDLSGKYQVFTGTVGIDDGVPTYVTPGVDFQIWGDGKLLFDSGAVGRGSAAVSFAVNTAGVKTLNLVATSTTPGNIDYCQADWAGTTLLAAPGAPASPTNVVATPNATPPSGQGSVAVTWQGDGTADNFTVQRSSDGGQSFTTIATVAGTAASYTDTGIAAGTYFYRVIGTNASGSSAPSAADDATVAKYVAPVAPTGLKSTATTTTSVSLSWTAVTGVTGYAIYRNGTSVGTVSGSATTAFTDTGLTASTAYQYTVASLDSFNAPSAPSAAVTATTVALPQIIFNDGSFETTRTSTYAYNPTTASWTFSGNAGLEANGSAWGAANASDGTQAAFLQNIGTAAGSVGQTFAVNKAGTFAFTFSLARRNGYGAQPILVTVDGTAVGTYTPASNSFQAFTTGGIALAVGNHTITFATTVTAGDNTSFLDAVSVKAVLAVPNAPTGLAASVVAKAQVNLSWNVSSDSPGNFILQRSTDGTTFTNVATLAGTVTSYADTTVAAATTYTYRILATNAAGSSAPSATASVTTLSATAVTTNLSSLNWTSATAGYGTVQQDASIKGNPISVGGKTYATGLGAHADSTITYNLNGGYQTFNTDVGLDDEVAGKAADPLYFQIVADGKVIWTSPTITATGQVYTANVSVAGVTTLQLVVKAVTPGNIDYAHADWAGATLTAAAPAPVALMAAKIAKK